MTLRSRLSRHPETIQEFRLAAETRYLDGLELMMAGRQGAGIYVMGYAAEMLLKNAYFLFTGAGPRDFVRPRLVPALRAAQVLIPSVGHEGYHSLSFWALLLLESRRWQRRPFRDGIEGPFLQRTRRLYQNWWVEMRYRSDPPGSLDARSVYDDVSWLRAHYHLLGR